MFKKSPKMMTRTEFQATAKMVIDAMSRAQHEEIDVFENEEYGIAFMPNTDSKKIMDHFFEREGGPETFLEVKNKDHREIYGLYGDHREKFLSLDMEGIKKYWKENSKLWSTLPTQLEKEDGEKPSIGFGIPEVKMAA